VKVDIYSEGEQEKKMIGYSELKGFCRSMKTQHGCFLGCNAVWSESYRPNDGGSTDL
jgi:hypothetical protein